MLFVGFLMIFAGVLFTASKSIKIGGTSYSQANRTIDGNVSVQASADVPAAKAGTLTTRTDNDTGVVTLGASHGIVDADRVDLYWEIGGVKGSRYGMTVGTVAGNDVPIDGGAGDNLPADESAVVLCKVVEHPFSTVGNNVKAIAASVGGSSARASVNIVDGSNVSLHRILLEAGRAYSWDNLDGTTNPLAGDTSVEVHLSHNVTTGSTNVKVGALV